MLEDRLAPAITFNPLSNGSGPFGGLIEDGSGNFFGTTYANSFFDIGSGTVFEVLAGSGTITTLASLNYSTSGLGPEGNLVEDSSGNLFGTASYGGANGGGTIFEVAAGSHTATAIASFNGANGANPEAGLVEDSNGDLFGTTCNGGAYGEGTVFEVVAGSGTITTLASFNGTDGAGPQAGLVEDSSGNLFGTTTQGGARGGGTVFEVAAGSNTITNLASFTSGYNSRGGLVEDNSGNFFGTTAYGGASNAGTVFEMAAGSGTITTLATFNGTNGANPVGTLVEDSSGNLFGTTYVGGVSNGGTVFEVAAGSGTITTLAQFDGTGEYGGYSPEAGLVEDSSGNLFGTTGYGGPNYDGTVFELTIPTPTVALGLSRSFFNEHGASATVTATLSNVYTQNVTVALGFSGGAVNGTDYSASGTNYNPSTGVLTIPVGSTSGTVTLTGLNNPAFVAPQDAVITINSVGNATVGNPNSVTETINYEPSVDLSLSGSSFSENDGSATVTATLSNAYTQDVTVALGFSGGAVNGTDYAASGSNYDAATGVLTVLAGSTSGTVTLTGLDNSAFVGPQDATVTINSVDNGTVGSPNSVTTTIDDAIPTVDLGLSSSSFSENGGTATVTATLSNPYTQDVTVSLGFGGSTADYSVTGGTDYDPSTGVITIPTGSTSGTVTLTGLENPTFAAPQDAIISINSVGSATVGGPNSVTATINDAPSVGLSLSSSSFSEDGGSATITATLSNVYAQNVTVALGFSGGAVDGTDYFASGANYDAATGVLTILAGSASGTVTLTGSDNRTFIGPLAAIVAINSVDDGAVGSPNSVTAKVLSGGDSIADAILLNFYANNTASATEFIATSNAVQINAINLAAGDLVTVSTNTQPYGGGLDTYLRIFDLNGPGGTLRQIASNDNYTGRDSQVTFQALTTGTYYIGVSSAGNTNYDPTLPQSGTGGTTQGLFDLDIRKTAASPEAILVGASFQVTGILGNTAVWGDTVSVSYTIENRGALASAAITVPILLSADNNINSLDLPLPASIVVPVLQPGTAVTGSITVKLPGSPSTPPTSFSQSQDVFLGISLGPNSPEQGNNWTALTVLQQAQVISSNSLANPNQVPLNSLSSGTLSTAHPTDYFQISLPSSPGLVNLQVNPGSGSVVRLALYDDNWNLLIQSDGTGSQFLTSIAQNLPVGTYYFEVTLLSAGGGNYSLATEFTAEAFPFQDTQVGENPGSIITGDFNGDGSPDIATASDLGSSLTVLLNNGDGTFRTSQTIVLPTDASDIATADFNNDGRLDIVALTGNTVSVMLGNGDGTFQSPKTFSLPNGLSGSELVTGDFNADGNTDLAVVTTNGDLLILLGNGNGGFALSQTITTLDGPFGLAVGDFSGDGNLDLATGNLAGESITVLLGNGDGTFRTSQTSYLGVLPFKLIAGNFEEDGHVDLATANTDADSVTILRGNGDGTFTLSQTITVGPSPTGIVAADFNGDGALDIATVNEAAQDLSVLVNDGAGNFTASQTGSVGSGAYAVVAADLTENGYVDLATANLSNNTTVSVVFGNGDGSFQNPIPLKTESAAVACATADFNNDGNMDIITANVDFNTNLLQYLNDNTLSVFLGNGDGTFRQAPSIDIDFAPTCIVTADFNGDGRMDIAVGGRDGEIAIFFGNGDGTFDLEQTLYVPSQVPGLDIGVVGLAAGDFNSDGHPDLVATSGFGYTVLLNNGDGTFRALPSVTVAQYGIGPPAVGDFTGNGKSDVAIPGNGQVYVYLSNGDGTFAFSQTIDATGTPVCGDFNDDGNVDLEIGGSIFLGNGQGAFVPTGFGVSIGDSGNVVAADFTGDGYSDLAFSIFGNNSVSVAYFGPTEIASISNFGPPQGFNAGVNNYFEPLLVVGDFNNDGRLDLAAVNPDTDSVSILLNLGSAFVSSGSVAVSVRSVPLLADFTNPKVPDSVILDSSGEILFRRADPDVPGTYGSPTIINPGSPARDIAIVMVGGVREVAAADADDDSISLYRLEPDGIFSCVQVLATGGSLPARIVAGNLADGSAGPGNDLVVYDSLSGTVSVFLSNNNGGFLSPAIIPVGLGGSDIILQGGQGQAPNIVIPNQSSGSVLVLVNNGQGVFDLNDELQYRASPGPFTYTNTISALQDTSWAAVADSTATNSSGVVTVNPGGDNFAYLPSLGPSSLGDPIVGAPLGFSPGYVVSADFNNDGNADLAILDPVDQTVAIFLGDGHGHFRFLEALPAGISPSALSVADVNGDGIPDLLVGSTSGDILVLLGNGDGTFKPFVNIEQAVPFVTTDAKGDVVLANQASNQLLAQLRQPGTTNFNPGSLNQQGNGLIAPGAIAYADLTNNGFNDLIVANSGSNDILVYMALPDGSFAAPVAYSVGTNPVSVTVQDLGNGFPDIVVANQGSNDVSILFGNGTGTFTEGPRLKAGNGPLGVTVEEQNGVVSGLLVSDSDGAMTSLPSVGNGFFNDTTPQTFSLGSPIIQALTGGFVATTTGIFQVNVNALTATEVFASTTLTSFNTFGNDLVAGFDDGSLALLSEENGKFAEDLTFRDAELTDPSALQMVNVNGQSEIYATTTGESRVFVFALSDGVPVLGPDAGGPPGDRSQTTTVQPVTDVGVALVATVVVGNGDFVLEESSELGFAVGLGETAGANVNALAFLTTLLTGSSGDSVESFAGGAGESAEALAPLNGFISGIEDAMRLFQLRISGTDATGGAAPRGSTTTNPADWRSLVDQAYSGFFQSATALGEIGQIPTRVGAYPLQALDAVMRSGLKSPDGTGGMEGTGFGLQAVLESIQQALRQTSRAVGRCLDGALLPDRGQGQQPVGPMSANDLDSPTPSPTSWAPRLLLPDPDGLPPSVPADPFDWQANLAVSLMLCGLWQGRPNEEERER